MVTEGVTSQPIGHYEFCSDHRAECNLVTTGSSETRPSDARKWKELTRRQCRRSIATIVPDTDMEVYGREEVWSLPADRR